MRIGVGARRRPCSRPVLLLRRREVGREEEHLQLAVLVERVGELAELLADVVELVLLLRDLEQRARVDRGDLFHGASRAPSPDSAEKSSSASASSTSRCWSSSVSVLRVTFSVARTVRSATSLRISWIARRVSASMSRRVCSISSSRLRLASSSDSRSCSSPALRARATISSACSRASLRRSRYSASSSSASVRVRSAVSIESSIACWRLSSASAMRGNASLRRMTASMPKTSSVQIISPTSGVTRKLPPSSSPASRAARTMTGSSIGLEEEGDQAGDEAVEDERLGQREAEPLDRGDLVAHLGLAGDRLDDLAEDVCRRRRRRRWCRDRRRRRGRSPCRPSAPYSAVGLGESE